VVRPGILRIIAGQDYHGYAIRSASTGQAGARTVLKGQDVSLPADRYGISDPDDAAVAPVEVTVEAGGVHEVAVGG
jgi:hypothetical protein